MIGGSWEAIDLFSGCGGFSHGLQAAGVRVAAGVDCWDACEFPFRVNHDGAAFFLADVADVSAGELAGCFGAGVRRLLVGSPPCQPYAMRGYGTWRDDARRQALVDPVYRMLELAVELDVDAVMLENVRLFASSEAFRDAVEFLCAAGFCVEHRYVWMYHYGVPQTRYRMFVVAYRPDVGFCWPAPWTGKRSSELQLRSVIGDLDTLAERDVDDSDVLHRVRPYRGLTQRRLEASRVGGTYADWPDELLEPQMRKNIAAGDINFRSVYGRLGWDDLPPTMVASLKPQGGRFGHPDVPRMFTMREAARIQTFPDSFRFVPDGFCWRWMKNFDLVYRLIGNAVPPRFSEQLAGGLLM